MLGLMSGELIIFNNIMSQINKKWQKLKYSSSFYRKCAKTRENILNFASNETIIVHPNINKRTLQETKKFNENVICLEESDFKERLHECVNNKENWKIPFFSHPLGTIVRHGLFFPASLVWIILNVIIVFFFQNRNQIKTFTEKNCNKKVRL